MRKEPPNHCNVSPQEIRRILAVLSETYPDAHCELRFDSPFHLLIATILSAQTTDKKVNAVTEKLFSRYHTPADFLAIPQGELETIIREIGLFHTKAKNILAACTMLQEQFGGQVPNTREDLMRLPGVGRKTANVVLGNAFSIPAFAVDTHVFRVSNRLGLAQSDSVSETEEHLTSLIPKERWIETHHQLIWHGRRICSARNPKCMQCGLKAFCHHARHEHAPG